MTLSIHLRQLKSAKTDFQESRVHWYYGGMTKVPPRFTFSRVRHSPAHESLFFQLEVYHPPRAHTDIYFIPQRKMQTLLGLLLTYTPINAAEQVHKRYYRKYHKDTFRGALKD